MIASDVALLLQAELARMTPELRQHVERWLVEPYVVERKWDYGDERYPCWAVLEHRPSLTVIAYCENGFGPKCPWGLLWMMCDGGDESRMSMGMDSSWFTSLEDAFLDSYASEDNGTSITK